MYAGRLSFADDKPQLHFYICCLISSYASSVSCLAAIAIKNMISRHWTPRELQRDHYLIADAERPHLRHRIFEMIIRSNKPIRLQLCVCLQRMLDHTFPEQWQGWAFSSILLLVVLYFIAFIYCYKLYFYFVSIFCCVYFDVII